MTKLIVLLLSVSIATSSYGQTTPQDSLSLSLGEDLMRLLDSVSKRRSTINLSIGIGNKLFSINNSTINTQIQVNKIYFTPAVAYLHKSGLSLSVMPYLASDSGRFKVYQTALSPAYDYSDKKTGFGISYTRYLADHNSYNSNAIYQNDFYGYIKRRKGIIQPSLSIGYSTGKYREINVLTFTLINPVTIRDSTQNSIKTFSLSGGAEHMFQINSIFSNRDGLSVIPKLMINATSEKFRSVHTNKNIPPRLLRSRRIKSRVQQTNSPIAFQSLALSMDAVYTIGNFFIGPNLYLEYYLPQTNETRFSTVFSVSLGYSF